MDYEKKYNEALERARQIKNGENGWGYYDLTEITPALEDVFPELSEIEDERITRAINNMLPFIPDKAYANNGVTKEGVLNWLEKQKEQKPEYPLTPDECIKPAEWSEEDEKHINIILRVLDRQQCWDGATGKKFNPYQDEVDWLKSLRPSWKPSVEQMKALEQAKISAVAGNYITKDGLCSLYEQLKKLM